MRACIAAIIIVVCSPGRLARAQSGTEVSPAIPVHPDVSTILQLPERIERSWTHYGDDFRVKGVGSKVYVRPHPGTPAGTEALLEVKTTTLHRIFLLRVVARAGDARREVVVSAAPGAACEQTCPDAQAAAPTPAEPATSAPGPAPAPAEPAPAPGAPEPTAPAPPDAPGARTIATAMSPRYDLSAHAVLGLGFIGLDIAGYRPTTALQPHHTLGLRLAGARRDTGWSLQADFSGEWPHGSMVYIQRGPASKIEVSGPRLRLELGMRLSLGARWSPSAYAGVGVQMHLRRLQETDGELESVETLAQGAVLTLGIGLQYRARRRSLLGFDLQIRQGGPDEYHSVVALLTMGRFLEQGD